YPVDGFASGQRGIGLVVDLSGCQDVHFMAGCGQVERQIGEDLAGRGMVGVEISVDEDELCHRGSSIRPRQTSCLRARARRPGAAPASTNLVAHLKSFAARSDPIEWQHFVRSPWHADNMRVLHRLIFAAWRFLLWI